MDELTSKIADASQLITKLKEERLLVHEERKVIQNLNEKVCIYTIYGKVEWFIVFYFLFQIYDYIKRLMQTAWINSYQKHNLHDLVLTRADFTSEQCCRRTRFLSKTVFIHAKEVLDYQVTIYFLVCEKYLIYCYKQATFISWTQ